ncbi:type II secretion system F family protein [Gimesia fumaroli]|uniref:Type II secretion system protein F n=1 Tax=Gimesia fumaroli TaxID=2527976 RepID=A0A518I4X6_9PLAN|nr:type II secretion system F family protein [Gimesia fumaroli]QDV48088.1 Type II secretion system protein F [Gimesia fumaroli]
MDLKSHFPSFFEFGRSSFLLGRGIFPLFGRVNYSQQVALLRILAVAAEKQLPLLDVLETFEKDIRGRWRYQVLRLIDLLRSGVPLADALETIPNVIPANAFFLVKAGAESGTLPSALALAAEVCAEQRNERDFLRAGFVLYFGIILLVLTFIFGFICYWIIPKLKHIFHEFDMPLPDLTINIIQTSDWVVKYYWVFPVIGILICLTHLLLIRMDFLERRRHWNSFPGLYPRGRAPDVLRFLHVTTESGRPLMGAFETLSHTTRNRYLSQRFDAILGDIRKGNDCWTALHDYSLLTPSEVRLLQSAQRAGNLSWALKAIAKSIERRNDYRIALIREYVEPAMIVCIGCLVGAFVVGLFLPLVNLMHSLA